MKSPPLLLRPSFYLPPPRSFGTRNNRNRTIASKREEEEEEKKFDRPSVESRNFFVYFVVLYRPRYLSSLFPSPLPFRDRGFRRDARARGQTIIISLRVIDRARSCDTLRERARLILNLLSNAIRAWNFSPPPPSITFSSIFFNFFFFPFFLESLEIRALISSSFDERNSIIRSSSLMQRSSKSVRNDIDRSYICVRSYARFPELIPSFVFSLGTRNYEMRLLNACKRYLHYWTVAGVFRNPSNRIPANFPFSFLPPSSFHIFSITRIDTYRFFVAISALRNLTA